MLNGRRAGDRGREYSRGKEDGDSKKKKTKKEEEGIISLSRPLWVTAAGLEGAFGMERLTG